MSTHTILAGARDIHALIHATEVLVLASDVSVERVEDQHNMAQIHLIRIYGENAETVAADAKKIGDAIAKARAAQEVA